LLSILFGLGASLGWGAGDYTGGLASRKIGAYRTVFYGEIIGILAILIVAVVIVGEPLPAGRAVIMASLAGTLGTIGLLMLYHSMTLGLMSIATSVSALLAAAMPVAFGMFSEGLPSLTTILGFVFALFAVWMISQSDGRMNDILRSSRGPKTALACRHWIRLLLHLHERSCKKRAHSGRWSSRALAASSSLRSLCSFAAFH